MYAVIFRAEINQLDQAYTEMAARMRDIAKSKYGCTEFISLSEGNQEMAISYWDNVEQIAAWKQDPEHQKAQALGRAKWYKSYQVQIMKLEREYTGNT